MTKILVYELNEVPWRVVDFYLKRRPNAFMHQYIEGASCLTTYTVDSGELHPWSTWPTMHRGVANDLHQIRYINQDKRCGDETPPMWELMVSQGKSVGLCGSLQSYPPIRNPLVFFHIPDTFALGAETVPKRYSSFQRVNLKLTGENKAVAKEYGLKDLLDGMRIFRSGVSFKTGLRLGAHLAREQANPLHRSLRATMQAHVVFDIFMDALKRAKPDYGAVFSNHVAGVMHRYWRFAFPEDFESPREDSKIDQFHSQSILKAMDIFDEQLGLLSRFAQQEGYDLIVSSSMGQEAVERGDYSPELKLDNEKSLASLLGFQGAFRMNLAMQPDVALEFVNGTELHDFSRSLIRLKDGDGRQVLSQRYDEQGLTLNLTVASSKAAANTGMLYLDGEAISLDRLGFSVIERDAGTGYHQPEGVWLWKGSAQPKLSCRESVDSRRYAPTVLRALGASCPEYMMPPVL